MLCRRENQGKPRLADPRPLRARRPSRRSRRPGGIAARARAVSPAVLSAGAQPRAARGGGDARRPGAGAGRRRHRQDARADHPHRAHPQPRPRAARRNPLRHLHQQGGARDEGAHRQDGRPGGRGHAVARHVPFDRRAHPAPSCRTRRPEVRFHHSRYRRPDQACSSNSSPPQTSTRSAGRGACSPA